MAEIPRAVLDYVTGQINALSASAQAAVLRVLESIEWTPDNVAECREAVVEALALILPAYTDSSAQASADLYDAVRLTALGEAYGASAISGYDAAATEGAVRALVQRIVDGGDVGSFNSAVLDRVDYEVKRAAGTSMIENGLADSSRTRYARVPTSAEACEFCLMLAGRGFVYLTRETAGEFHHYHPGCRCRVIAGWDGMTVEGYDPDAYDALWRESVRLKELGMPVKQREAIMAAMRDNLMPQFSSSQAELADLYDIGLRSAWAEFKRLGKAADAYQNTVGAYLGEIGSVCGGRFSAEYLAKPDGDEIWGAIQLSDEYSSIRFRYADYSTSNPDFLLNGELAELKTPRSRRKVTNRLTAISSQFEPYPDERKLGIISSLHLSDDEDYIIETAQRFVDDGTLDEVIVIRSDGSTEHLRQK